MHHNIIDKGFDTTSLDAVEDQSGHLHLKESRQPMQTKRCCNRFKQSMRRDSRHQPGCLRRELELVIPRTQVQSTEVFAARQSSCHFSLILDWISALYCTLVKPSVIYTNASRIRTLGRLLRCHNRTGIWSTARAVKARLESLLSVLLDQICNPRAARPAHRWLWVHLPTVSITLQLNVHGRQ